mmetsp:Transcript_93872/g.166066  ORF Transcript_93872/g.166066 Transcript_93872/m.166066 type:complete len:999 (-) Transcript_93872:162-3158(-)
MLCRVVAAPVLFLFFLQFCISEPAIENDQSVKLQALQRKDIQDSSSDPGEEVSLVQWSLALHKSGGAGHKDAAQLPADAEAARPTFSHAEEGQPVKLPKGRRPLHLLAEATSARGASAAAPAAGRQPLAVLRQAVANVRENSTAGLQEGGQHGSKTSRADPKPGEEDFSKYDELFRPVSATVRNTIIIAMLCLLIYSSLAITVNILELSERPDKISFKVVSVMKELQAKLLEGVALVKFLPLFACQFVAFRMYVLAATEGLGEPPIWAKRTMDVTVGVQLARTACILLLPSKLLLHLAASEGQDRKVPTDEAVVDKVMKPFEESGYSQFSIMLAKRAQVVFSVLSVLSWCALLTGIWIFSLTHRKPSPPIIATNFVCGWCIINFELVLWWSAALQPTREKALRAERHHRAFRYGTRALRKAPMFGVLMLADRLRAMQINPPAGLQQEWAYVAMFTACGAMAAETLVCMHIGYYLLEVKSIEKDLFRSRLIRHFFAGVFFACTATTVGSIFVIPNTAHIQFELSTTVYITIMLSAIYYAVHAAQWLWAVYMDLWRHQETVVLETLLQLTMSINICPLLGILFVACRMRALQISGNEGDPQAWAQDCMRITCFGVFVQVVLALALPIFTGGVPSVAADGSPRFEKSPLTLAYLVSVVKWVSLIAIHGSAIAVAISIFLINPRKALLHSDADAALLVQAAKVLTVFTLVATVAFVLLSAKMLGLLVKFAVESVDKSLLGVTIEIKQVLISLWQQRLTIMGLTVKNPDIHEWRSDCLANLTLCIVEVRIWSLIRHGVIEINVLALQHVEVNFERPIEHYSNVHYVLDVIKKGKKKKKPVTEEEKKEEKKKANICLHQIALTDVKAKLLSTRLGNIFSLVVADWNQKDYAKETGHENLHMADVVMLVLETLLDTILHNVGCQAVFKEAKAVAAKEENVCAAAASKICSKSEPKPKAKAFVGKKLKYLQGGPEDPGCCGKLLGKKTPEEREKKDQPITEITRGY